MTKGELREIIKAHERWLNGDGGECADLSGANLRDVDLSRATLRGADLSGADLSRADLSRANLRGANLRGATLRGATLRGATLRGADLSDVDLSRADLRGADLCRADLRGADLSELVHNEGTAFYALQCPEDGSFIGYKKAHGHIVKLEILADAKRSSATSRKCRCSAAKVISITAVNGCENVKEIASDRDPNFVYRVGEVVRVDYFDDNRWNECSTGIHFFITRSEAEQYEW